MSLSIKHKRIPSLIINLVRPILRKNQISILQRLRKEKALLIVPLVVSSTLHIHITEDVEPGGETRIGVDSLEGFPSPFLVHWVFGYAVGVVVGFEDFGPEVVGAGFDPEAGSLEIGVLAGWRLGAIDCCLYAGGYFRFGCKSEARKFVNHDECEKILVVTYFAFSWALRTPGCDPQVSGYQAKASGPMPVTEPA